MAMKHVDTCPWCVASHNSDDFAGSYPHNVFPTRCLIWHHFVAISRARQHLEVDKVDMNRVRRISTSVSQLPDLVLTQNRSCQDTVLDILPAYTIDEPLAVDSGKSEALGNVGLRWWRDVTKLGRYGIVVGAIRDGITNYESHDTICCRIVDIAQYAALVAHCDVLAYVLGKVDNDLVAFAFGNGEPSCVYGMGEQS